MKLICAIALSCLVGLAPWPVQASVALTPEELELLPLLFEEDLKAVHDHAKEILGRCKFPECVIVSLGTTNTLVDSFLRYYLKGDADRAIHYVPFRELNSITSVSAVIERSLPKPSADLKRVVVVRTLLFGTTIAVFADAVERQFAKEGTPYELEAFFSVADQFEKVSSALENKDGRSRTDAKFPWPYTIRKLPFPTVVDGSYRAIDSEYYRYLPLVFNFENFWSDFQSHPKVVDFKRQVERSVGADQSIGPKLFEASEEVKEAWAMALESELKNQPEPFLIFPLFLSYYSEASRNYAAAMKTVQREVFAEFEYPEGTGYKVLDQTVKLFIEDPELFEQKQCAALVASGSK